jgi:hypothetical protein
MLDEWDLSDVKTISPTEVPEEYEVEAVSAVMALQHAGWLGLLLGVVNRGAGRPLGPRVSKFWTRTSDPPSGVWGLPKALLLI